jgi:hypothetical protein
MDVTRIVNDTADIKVFPVYHLGQSTLQTSPRMQVSVLSNKWHSILTLLMDLCNDMMMLRPPRNKELVYRISGIRWLPIVSLHAITGLSLLSRYRVIIL